MSDRLFVRRHSGACEARTRNLEIPDNRCAVSGMTGGKPSIPPPPGEHCRHGVLDTPLSRSMTTVMPPPPSHHRFDARQRRDQFPEPSAADLEIAVLVERRAGRRQQHHRVGKVGGFGVARGVGHRDIERFADFVGRLAVKGRGKLLRRLPDQIRLAQAREIIGQAGDAAELGLAAGNPENIRE